MLDIETLRRRLPGAEIHYFESLDSTMHAAARLGAEGAPSGATVIAEEQTAGQGRLGRRWHSEKGTGLYVSILLRLHFESDAMPLLSLAIGLAAAEAIARASGLACDLRWPNDLLLQDRKVAGILVQLSDGTAVAGIGINVNQTWFPDEIAAEATSLRLVSGAPHSREQLLEFLLPAVDRFSEMLSQGGRYAILDLFSRSSSYIRRKRVRIQGTGERGTTAGLDDSGFLILEKDDGSVSRILAGGVRPA